MAIQFDHERLKVYQEALRFVAWVAPMTAGLIARFSGEVREEPAAYNADAFGREKEED